MVPEISVVRTGPGSPHSLRPCGWPLPLAHGWHLWGPHHTPWTIQHTADNGEKTFSSRVCNVDEISTKLEKQFFSQVKWICFVYECRETWKRTVWLFRTPHCEEESALIHIQKIFRSFVYVVCFKLLLVPLCETCFAVLAGARIDSCSFIHPWWSKGIAICLSHIICSKKICLKDFTNSIVRG